MKKQFLILFAFISVLALSQVPQRFNKVIVTGDITSPKFIKTGSNADSVLLGNGSARSVNSLKTDTVSLSNRINAKATGNGTANGTNTGDETLTSIKTKLGAATSVSDGYLKYQDWNAFNSKEPAITKNSGFNLPLGTTAGTVLEGRTFGSAANNAVGDFIQNQNSSAQSANMWIKGLSDIPMLVGENYTSNSSDAQIVINRNVDDVNGDGAGYNAHAFSDSSPITRSGGISYNSFDGRVNYSGTANYGHNATFQSAPTFGSSGTITDLYNFISAPTVNTGIATNNYGFYLSDPVGTGTVVNNYGVYIPQLSKGSTKNFAIYTHGSTKNYMGGRTQIGSDISGYTTLLNLYGTASDLAILSMRPYAAGDDVGIRLYSNSGTPYGVLSGSDATGIIKIGGVSENFFLTFWAGNLERVRVDKGGNVGIGYTTETPITNNKLAVNGTGFFSGNITASSFSGSGSSLTGVQLPITLTTNGTSGAATFSGHVLNVPNYDVSGGVNQTQTTVNGSTSGNMVCSMPFRTGSYKKVIIRVGALNGTATYTYPVAFSFNPVALSNSGSGVSGLSISTTSITVTGTTSTAILILEGY